MEEFLSLAAHDLRSPMRQVHQVASMLREDLPKISDDSMQLLDMLETIAGKSMQMISDVINRAHAVDVASTAPIHEQFSLMTVCWDVLHTIDPEQRHEWKIGNTFVVGEPVAVQIVLRNLLDNAIKHNDEKLKLSVDARQVDSEWIELLVSDNGKGFSIDHEKQTLNEPRSGESGFGLSGVRRLIDSRGGCLSLDEPVPGQGATIRVRLPGKVVEGFEDSVAG